MTTKYINITQRGEGTQQQCLVKQLSMAGGGVCMALHSVRNVNSRSLEVLVEPIRALQ